GFSTNIITELEDNALILVDGNYTLTISNSCTVRWQKTETTIAGFFANNRTVTGTYGFWGRVELAATLSVTPQIQYLKVFDATYGMLIRPSTGFGDGTTVKKIWVEGADIAGIEVTGAAYTVNVMTSRIFTRNCRGSELYPTATFNAFIQT